MALRALLLKDARLVLRNRPLLAALLAYPLLLALVLASAFQEPPQTLDLAVADLDRSGQTVDVGGTPLGVDDLLASAESFADVRRVADESAGLALLRQGRVDALLVVPPRFMQDLATLGRNATLGLVVDESDPVRAGIARSAVEGAVDAFIEQIVQKKIDDVLELLRLTVEGGETTIVVPVRILGIDGSIARLEEVRATLPERSEEAAKVQQVLDFLGFARAFLGDSERYLTTTAVPLRVEARGLTGVAASVTDVALPGALVLGVFWTGSLSAALLAARERDTGAHRRLAAAPSGAFAQIASKTIVALVVALVPAAILLGIGITLLDAQVVDPPTATLALALSALSAASLGALAAALTRHTGGAALLVVLALLPMLLLGGLFYPIAYMPDAAQLVASILPVAMATDALRDAMLRASPLAEVALPLAGLALSALLLAGVAWGIGRRSP